MQRDESEKMTKKNLTGREYLESFIKENRTNHQVSQKEEDDDVSWMELLEPLKQAMSFFKNFFVKGETKIDYKRLKVFVFLQRY